MTNLKKGDIVKYEDSPTEVLALVKDHEGAPLLFVINKRSLNAAFIKPDQCEFVRRPNQREPK